MSKPPEITAEYIDAVESRLRSTYSSRDSDIQEMRDLVNMRNMPKMPAGMESEVVVAPTAAEIQERMVGLLTTDDVRIEVTPVGLSDDDMRRADKMEKWTMAAFDRLDEQADEDTTERMTECSIRDGVSVGRMLYAPGLWKGYPRYKDLPPVDADEDDITKKKRYKVRAEDWKKGKPIPIVRTWVDPLCAFPTFSEAGMESMLEVDERDLVTLRPEQFNMAKENPELWDLDRYTSSGGAVEFKQYWTRDTLTYVVDHKIVHHVKHHYRTPPYVYAMGQGISSKVAAERGRSMLYNLKYLIPYRDRLLSQQATAIRIWCWPTPIIKQTNIGGLATDAVTGKPQLRAIDIIPGQAVSLYSDEEIQFLVWQGNGPDIDKMISRIDSMIERAGLSDVMYGGSAGDSGYAVNQLIAAARVRFRPLIKHLERALESQIRTMWDIVEYQIGQPVPLYIKGKAYGWTSLGPDDLQDYRVVKAYLQPIIPTDKYAQSSMAINEFQSGLRDQLSAMTLIGITNPQETRDAILVDKYLQTPEVQQIITQAALERVGVKLQQEKDLSQSVTPEQFQEMWAQLPPEAKQAIAMQELQQNPPQGGATGQAPPDMGGGQPMVGQPGDAMGMLQQGAPGMGQMPVNPNQAAFGPPVMAAPGTYASPMTPAPQGRGLGGAAMNQGTPKRAPAPKKVPKQGKRPRPQGVATGRPTGPRKVGIE